ncbi:MAG TPA: DUF2934 domain-containing protein [Nitrospiraceae bacterium]|nr:DUF2934 domain-containing protein [Nitrospiraceae bacterium]
MARKRKAGESANGNPHPQPPGQTIEAGDTPPADGNGTKSHQLHASIAALAYELYERRGRADGFDVDDWLKAEELLAAGAGGAQGTARL